MSVLNQAHVEAICSATYLQNYLDCLETLPDDLQKILTQIREVDLKLAALEDKIPPFEEALMNLKESEAPDNGKLADCQQMLLDMQEFEDQKIQLSNSLMEYIETRIKQLESDRENLDPANHVVNDGNSKNNNSNNKRNHSEAKSSSMLYPSASTHSVEGNNKQADQRSTTSSTKKRKQKMESAISAAKSSSLNSKSNHCVNNSHSGFSSATKDAKEDTSAKKHSAASQEDVKSAGKLPAKRKRRSRAGTQSKSQKEAAVEPVEPEEPTYCICEQVSYGEMIGCDNDACPIEWFHFNCVNLTNKPKGKWFCPKCRGDKQTVMRRGADKGR